MGRLLMKVETRRPTSDAQQESASWKRLRDEWFQLEPASGREQNNSGQIEVLITHTAESTYFDEANGSLRLRWSNRIFDVESVLNIGEQNRRLKWKLVEQQ